MSSDPAWCASGYCILTLNLQSSNFSYCEIIGLSLSPCKSNEDHRCIGNEEEIDGQIIELAIEYCCVYESGKSTCINTN